jgi:hypothetical protein
MGEVHVELSFFLCSLKPNNINKNKKKTKVIRATIDEHTRCEIDHVLSGQGKCLCAALILSPLYSNNIKQHIYQLSSGLLG